MRYILGYFVPVAETFNSKDTKLQIFYHGLSLYKNIGMISFFLFEELGEEYMSCLEGGCVLVQSSRVCR